MHFVYSFVSATVLVLKELTVSCVRDLLELKTTQDNVQLMIQYLITRRD